MLDMMNAFMNMPFLWDITNLGKNVNSIIKTMGGLIIVGVGLVLLIFGAIKIAQAFMGNANGGGRVGKIVLGVLAILVGGAFSAKGIDIVIELGKGGEDTIRMLGN